jgi:hypothetical protein
MTISATTQGLKPGVCTSSNRPANPFDGMMIYETDTNLVRIWNGTAWRTLSYSDYTSGSVIQVASATKTDSFTTTSTSYVDITGLSVSMSPTSTSSKVLISYTVSGQGVVATNMGFLQIVRDSTAIGNGVGSGSRPGIGSALPELSNFVFGMASSSYLDSPNTTSSTTYKIQVRSNTTGTVYINRSITDTDSAVIPRTTSSITVMEIAG